MRNCHRLEGAGRDGLWCTASRGVLRVAHAWLSPGLCARVHARERVRWVAWVADPHRAERLDGRAMSSARLGLLSVLLRGARCLLHVACCLLQSDSMVVHEFGELIRKMFNPRNFRGAVSPHELWQVRAALYCRARTAASRLH